MTTPVPRILLVEDDAGDALLVRECLFEAGAVEADVTWVRTVTAGRAAILEQLPQCVLLDLGLPDAEGLSAVHQLVDEAADTPVIVLTGRNDGGTGDAAVAAGAQDYLVKDDITPDLLARAVRYAVERKRAQQTDLQLRAEKQQSAENARLERGLLPNPQLRSDLVECATYYQPGRNLAVLGGDFFDVVETDDGRVRAVIGDVMGHGPDQAAIGVHLRVAWRTLVLAGVRDEDMLANLARLLHAETGGLRGFVTACDLTIFPNGTITVRVAGHPAPLLCPAGDAYYLPVEVGSAARRGGSGRCEPTLGRHRRLAGHPGPTPAGDDDRAVHRRVARVLPRHDQSRQRRHRRARRRRRVRDARRTGVELAAEPGRVVRRPGPPTTPPSWCSRCASTLDERRLPRYGRRRPIRSLRRRVGATFLATLVLLVVLLAVIFAALVDLQRKGDEVVERWQPAFTLSQDMLSDLVNQETGVRGYALSREQSLLAPYTEYYALEQRQQKTLRGLLSGREDLLAGLTAVEAAAQNWRTSFAQPFIDRVRAGDPSVAQDAAGPLAKAAFDRIRAVSAQLTGERALDPCRGRARARHRAAAPAGRPSS